jgi:hypothetical protein
VSGIVVGAAKEEPLAGFVIDTDGGAFVVLFTVMLTALDLVVAPLLSVATAVRL